MDFANERAELRRLLLLAVVVLAVELVLPRINFALLSVSTEWSVPLQLLVLSLPRFVVMLALVLMFGPFRKSPWFVGFLVAYIALVVARFYQSETFVDWSNAVAASRATLPYAAGVVGAVLAFWLRRKGQAAGISAPAF